MHTRAFLPHLPALAGDALLLLARLAPAAIFWQSGRTKVDGWQLNDSAIYLFQHAYQVPLLSATSAALLAALGLLGMTLVIQLFVYPAAWPTHGTCVLALLLLLGQGPGRLSLDHWIRACWQRRAARGNERLSGNGCVEHADPEQCLRAPQ